MKRADLNELRDVPGGIKVHGLTVNYDRACLGPDTALVGLNLIVSRRSLPTVLALLDALQPREAGE